MSDAGLQALLGQAIFGGEMFSEVGDDLKPKTLSIPSPWVKGRDFLIDPVSRDYVLDATGQFKMTNNILNAVYLCLMIDAANPDPNDKINRGWWADPSLGSLLYLIRRSKAIKTLPALCRNYVMKALQPLIDNQLIANLNVTCIYEKQYPDPISPRLVFVATMLDISLDQTRNFMVFVPVSN